MVIKAKLKAPRSNKLPLGVFLNIYLAFLKKPENYYRNQYFYQCRNYCTDILSQNKNRSKGIDAAMYKNPISQLVVPSVDFIAMGTIKCSNKNRSITKLKE